MRLSSGAARLRALFARRPWIYWLVVIALVSVVGLNIRGALVDLDHQRRQWGATTPVWIASQAIDPGDPVVAVARRYPQAMVPAGVVDTDPSGRRAIQRIGAGEIVVGDDILAGGLAATVGPGRVAVPIGGVHPFVEVGDEVRVVGNGADHAGTVIAVGDDAVMVSVAAADAAAVAAAASSVGVAVALRGRDG